MCFAGAQATLTEGADGLALDEKLNACVAYMLRTPEDIERDRLAAANVGNRLGSTADLLGPVRVY